LRVAAVQLNSTADRDANLAKADRLTRAAAADAATLVVLPEKWTAIGRDEDLRAAAQPLDGAAVGWARQIARELQIDLIAGSIVERVPGREKLANTSVHVGPSGDIKAVYRKVHMFDVDIEGRAYRESALEDPGDEIVLSATAPPQRDAGESGDAGGHGKDAGGVQLGMSICYDLRFPELFRILALRGARIVALPAAFTLPTTRAHWDTLVRARAIENQVFMVAANQVGSHPGGNHSGGRSMIVDPWGEVLAQAGEEEGHIAAELDLERQREIRAQLPSLANRQPTAYRWPAESERLGSKMPGGGSSGSEAAGGGAPLGAVKARAAA
jgi:predicted amidohydrolase